MAAVIAFKSQAVRRAALVSSWARAVHAAASQVGSTTPLQGRCARGRRTDHRAAAVGGGGSAPFTASNASRSRRWLCSGPAVASDGFVGEQPSGLTKVPELVALMKELRVAALQWQPEESISLADAERARLDAAHPALQSALMNAPIPERLALVNALADLAALPGRPYTVGSHLLLFIEEYTQTLGALRDGETIADRATELRHVLLYFHRARISADRIRLIHEHVAQEFPQFEAAGALLPLQPAVRFCHTMLATGLSSPKAIVVLLRSALRTPLVHIADDAWELRLLKMVELLVRLDFLHTQEQLPKDVAEYLSVIRSLRYYDRSLRRDTPLSYQLAFFLRKHGFPAERHMLGPYPLKVCDPEARINFEPVEEWTWRPGLPEEPPARKRRHLEALGWRHIEVHAATWSELGIYDAKAAHVRSLLKEHELLDI